MTRQRPAYLDYHSTTPLDSRVLERMMPFLTEDFGNASSKHHSYGWFAAEAVEVAREHVSTLIGAAAREVVFTSGATESNNLAIRGVAHAKARPGKIRGHLVTQATEHKAVLDVMRALESEGFETTVLPVDREGRVAVDALENALRDDTLLVSIMSANNEVGTIQDLHALGAVCRERGVLLHTDAAQTVGKLPMDLSTLPVDLVSFSAHKFYGPKGVGALFLRRRDPRVNALPSVHGGGHERGLRSGTLNVAGIVGIGAAAAIAGEDMASERTRVEALRGRLEKLLLERIDGSVLNGPVDRLYNNLNMSFLGVEADALLSRARDVAASSGSACTSASLEPSHVLTAMGLSRERVRSAVRFGLGRFSEASDVERAVESLREAHRSLSAN